jgi:hypothetical protein
MDVPLTCETKRYRVVINATVELPVGLSDAQVLQMMGDQWRNVRYESIHLPAKDQAKK